MIFEPGKLPFSLHQTLQPSGKEKPVPLIRLPQLKLPGLRPPCEEPSPAPKGPDTSTWGLGEPRNFGLKEASPRKPASHSSRAQALGLPGGLRSPAPPPPPPRRPQPPRRCWRARPRPRPRRHPSPRRARHGAPSAHRPLAPLLTPSLAQRQGARPPARPFPARRPAARGARSSAWCPAPEPGGVAARSLAKQGLSARPLAGPPFATGSQDNNEIFCLPSARSGQGHPKSPPEPPPGFFPSALSRTRKLRKVSSETREVARL
ncbi:basic proline-rich protein-like [Grammomys surdaster]|uniref:basic proline-rich protein-like n=1 Tax=Grammomys surdaster TaxID=491861 RepID=UPI00109F17AA|nr:basic proline-rich protein-like [Grammomys surdaster]